MAALDQDRIMRSQRKYIDNEGSYITDEAALKSRR